MPTVSRDDLKKKGFHRLVKSFTYAFDGLKYAFKYEQNILVHTLVTILVIIAGIVLKISSPCSIKDPSMQSKQVKRIFSFVLNV